MKYEVRFSPKIIRQLKKLSNKHYDMELFYSAIEILASGEKLPNNFKDHALKGNRQGEREFHLQPDWIVIYRLINNELIIEMIETGSHKDLFSI